MATKPIQYYPIIPVLPGHHGKQAGTPKVQKLEKVPEISRKRKIPPMNSGAAPVAKRKSVPPRASGGPRPSKIPSFRGKV